MKKRQALYILTPPLIILISIVTVWNLWAKKKTIDFIFSQIPKINTSQNFFDIKVTQLDISVLKLQLTAQDVTLTFKNDLSYLDQFSIDQIKLQADPFDLLIGQISASYLQIDQTKAELSEQAFNKLFKSENSNPNEINLDPLFKLLPSIPVQNLYLTRSDFSIKVPASEQHNLKSLKLRAEKIYLTNKLNSIDFSLSDTQLKAISNYKNIESSIDLFMDGNIDRANLKRTILGISKNQSVIQIELSSKKIKTILTNPQAQIEIKGQLQLEDASELGYLYKKDDSRWPKLYGKINIKSELKVSSINTNEGIISIDYNDVSVDALKFGNGNIQSKIKNSQFGINLLKIEHPSGSAELKNITIENKRPFNFKADLEVKDFSLSRFFDSLNLDNIPAHLDLNAQAECSGQIIDLKVMCKAALNARDIKINGDSKSNAFNIISLKTLRLDGDIYLNNKEMNYKASGQLVTSRFVAEGKIHFKEGYEVHAQSEYFDLSEIENLASLGLKGIISGNISSQGHTQKGVIDSELFIKSAILDNFYLGDVKGNLSYNDGLLSIQSINGQVTDSNYNGQIQIDMHQKLTFGSFQIAPLYVPDILSMIEEKWHLPIVASGSGSAKVQFSGPLDFWKLKLKLDLNLNKASLFNESFAQIKGQIDSNGEKMEFLNFNLHKPTGFITLSQSIDTKSNPELNLKINSTKLKVEDIDHLTQFYKNIEGDLNLEGSITGPLQNAKINTKSSVTQFELNGYKFGPSSMISELNKNFFSTEGNLLGDQIKTKLKIPFTPNENYDIKMNIEKATPFIALPFINLPLPNYGTTSNLDADIDLSTIGNNFNRLNGKINIKDFSLNRNLQTLKLTEPTEIIFNNHLISMTPLNLVGPNQTLSVKLIEVSDQPRFLIDGRLFLKPLQFLVPFTENFTGILEFKTQARFINDKIDFQGEGLINDATILAKGFPYPLTDISAFFNMSNSKIKFTELSALLNQTPIDGSGFVDIKGPKNIQVDIKASSGNLEIEFPKDIKTEGMAKLAFFGNWLPYTLQVDYNVMQGHIAMEFGKSGQDGNIVLAPSAFLPEDYLKKEAQGMILDTKANFQKGVTIKNSLIEGVLSGYINATGSPSSPVLEGQIRIQPGSKLIFKDKPFEIQSGDVRFTGSKEINPEIQVVANSRVSDYDIALNIRGPSKKLDIQATSQPQLSKNDIFSLLALGYTSSGADQSISNNNQNVSSEVQQKQTGLEVLSVLGNQSEFSKKIQTRLGVNVQLSPSIDSTRNIAVPKVIVSKKLGKKLTTSYARPLTGDRQNNEVKLQWMFRPDTSVILNYQNQPNIQENNILLNQSEDIGVGGIDIEYKKEFQ